MQYEKNFLYWGMKKLTSIKISDADKTTLTKLVKGRNTAQKIVLRAKIVLYYSDGMKQEAIATKIGTTRVTVAKWIHRFHTKGLPSILKDAPRKGRIPRITAEQEKAIIEKTLQEKPKGASHWSTRTLAKKMDVSKMTIQRLWKKYNIKPHLTKTFKISNDKDFVKKVEDVVGLYLNPPERAMVISVDEKSQIQALDRTQPGLPMKKGRLGTMTHDYKRHGTTSLFAALNVFTGEVMGECYQRHTQDDFLRFLKKVEKNTPRKLDLHIVLDNYATHKTEKIKGWLKKHPRIHFHFIPTSSSWLNLVERFFSEISNKMIRRSVFTSVPQLIASIMKFLEAHNEDPKIFVWTKDADTIINKVNKAREALSKVTAK